MCVSVTRLLMFVPSFATQAITEILMPNVTVPVDVKLTVAIREFAKAMEGWIEKVYGEEASFMTCESAAIRIVSNR